MGTGTNLPNCNRRNNYWRPCRKLPVVDDCFFYVWTVNTDWPFELTDNTCVLQFLSFCQSMHLHFMSLTLCSIFNSIIWSLVPSGIIRLSCFRILAWAKIWSFYEVMAMAQLRHLEIRIDTTDQLLIQFKLENVLNFVRRNICGWLIWFDKWKSKALPILP